MWALRGGSAVGDLVGEVSVGVTDGLAVATSVECEAIVPSCVYKYCAQRLAACICRRWKGRKGCGDVCTIRSRRIGNEIDGAGDRSKFGSIGLRVSMVGRL